MRPDRIAELLEPFLGPAAQQLTARDLDHISTYIDILLRWNTRINLTAIRDPEQIVTRHFGESLFAARHLFPRTAHSETTLGSEGGRAALQGRVKTAQEIGALAREAVADDPLGHRVTVADIGSGAGFPGIPIKLWAPHIALTLIESNHKKATFLREIARAITLTNVDIQNARAEDFLSSTNQAAFDVVTFRAVERFEVILPIAANLVAPRGRLALLVGSVQVDAAHSHLPGLSWYTPVPIPGSRSRVLAVAVR
jgi:16S rRNA (guanine527-N7)-methyltransferase